MLKRLLNVIDSVARLICLIHIGDMEPFRIIRGEIVTGTHAANWLRYMAPKMYLWISEMYYSLFSGFPESMNADCLSPSFQLN